MSCVADWDQLEMLLFFLEIFFLVTLPICNQIQFNLFYFNKGIFQIKLKENYRREFMKQVQYEVSFYQYQHNPQSKRVTKERERENVKCTLITYHCVLLQNCNFYKGIKNPKPLCLVAQKMTVKKGNTENKESTQLTQMIG